MDDASWSPRTRRTSTVLLLMPVFAAMLLAGTASPASAHATAMLDGKNAVAGKRGIVTMRIPHGCNGNLATDRVKIRFGKGWKAKPKPLEGWSKKRHRRSNGATTVVWRTTGEPLAPTETADFRVKVRYPKKSGVYRTPTIQGCGDVKSRWTEPDRGGATADHPYPPEYPAPRIKVLPC